MRHSKPRGSRRSSFPERGLSSRAPRLQRSLLSLVPKLQLGDALVSEALLLASRIPSVAASLCEAPGESVPATQIPHRPQGDGYRRRGRRFISRFSSPTNLSYLLRPCAYT